MKRTSFSKMQCSMARSLELIGDWWSPLIIRDLYLGIVRFDELVENLAISRNLLARRLGDLVRGGVVERRIYQKRPLRYEYALTDAGRDLVPVLVALTAWGDRWAQPKEGAPMLFVHRTCGATFTPQVCCDACGQQVNADNLGVRPGPGAAAKTGTKVLARRFAQGLI